MSPNFLYLIRLSCTTSSQYHFLILVSLYHLFIYTYTRQTFGRYLLDLRNGVVAPPGTKTVPTPRSHRMSTVVVPTRELLENAADNVDHPLTQVK